MARRPSSHVLLVALALVGPLAAATPRAALGASEPSPAATELESCAARFPVVRCLSFRVGEAEYVAGPVARPIDSPLAAYPLGAGVRAYSANAVTWRLDGGDLGSLRPSFAPDQVVMYRGPPGSFDQCGRWLQAVYRDSTVIRGWYHAETRPGCDYTTGYSHRSVGYAESSDGLHWTFPRNGRQTNQVLTHPVEPPSDHPIGPGDQTVVRVGDWFYMYFRYYDQDAHGMRTGVARAPVSSGGKPGSWLKFSPQRRWDAAGVGGKPGSIGFIGYAASVFVPSPGNPGAHVALVGMDPYWSGKTALKLSLSAPGSAVTFTTMDEPLLLVDRNEWIGRSPSSLELVGYPSMLAPGAARAWTSTFWLFYTYLEPGTGFGRRFLVRRRVDVTFNPAPPTQQVGVAWTRYYAPTTARHRVTTELAPAPFGKQWTVGYLYTRDKSGVPGQMRPIEECQRADSRSWPVSAAGCAREGFTFQRTLGWAWAGPHPGTSAIYRCRYTAAGGVDYFAGSSCGRATPDGLLGYVPVPP